MLVAICNGDFMFEKKSILSVVIFSKHKVLGYKPKTSTYFLLKNKLI